MNEHNITTDGNNETGEHTTSEHATEITLNTISQINYWTTRFNCNEAELRKVIKAMGSSSVNIVEKFFQK